MPPETRKDAEKSAAKMPAFVCEGMALVIPYEDVMDSPHYFFKIPSRKIAGICGSGRIDPGNKEALYIRNHYCPPLSWKEGKCDEKYKEFLISQKTELDEEHALKIAESEAGCHPTSRPCEIKAMKANENYAFEIFYLNYEAGKEDRWIEMFGLKKIVISKKGEIIETTKYKK